MSVGQVLVVLLVALVAVWCAAPGGRPQVTPWWGWALVVFGVGLFGVFVGGELGG